MARPPKYPWRTIAVGESFLAIGVKNIDLLNTARVYHRPKRFSTKQVLVKGQRGVRVWRVA